MYGIVIAHIYESSNVFLMLWDLDAKHIAIIIEKDTDTEKCFWTIGISGNL